tara:strand:- start:226 stop:1254 length:1029 start_codon:yes stop_codon:yes gene_type:complete
LLRYFRQNDPFRIIGIVLFILASRAIALVGLKAVPDPVALTVAFPSDLFVGAAGPLYGLLQWGLAFVFNSPLLNTFLASAFVLVNATTLNALLIRNSAFEENTYVPAALFTILFSFHPSVLWLSAELIASTFFLLALVYLQRHLRYRNSDETVLTAGIFLGLSSLFYIPFAWYVVLALLLFLFYSGTLGRRYLLLFWGFSLTLIGTWMVFLFQEEGADFWLLYAPVLVDFDFNQPLVLNALMGLCLPVAFSFVASTSNLAGMGMTNLQITLKRVFTWIGIFGILTFCFLSGGQIAGVVTLTLALAYFCTEFLLHIQRKWLAELFFLSLIALSVIMLFLQPFY